MFTPTYFLNSKLTKNSGGVAFVGTYSYATKGTYNIKLVRDQGGSHFSKTVSVTIK